MDSGVTGGYTREKTYSGRDGDKLSLSLSVSVTHAHTHTHTVCVKQSLQPTFTLRGFKLCFGMLRGKKSYVRVWNELFHLFLVGESLNQQFFQRQHCSSLYSHSLSSISDLLIFCYSVVWDFHIYSLLAQNADAYHISGLSSKYHF